MPVAHALCNVPGCTRRRHDGLSHEELPSQLELGPCCFPPFWSSTASRFAARAPKSLLGICGGLPGLQKAKTKIARRLPKGANLRDNMSAVELATVDFAEFLATTKIEQENARGNGQCERTCRDAGQIVAAATAQFLGK